MTDTTRKGEVETRLLDCPFEHPIVMGVIVRKLGVCFYADCRDCGASTYPFTTKAEAIEHWNSRATSNATYNEAISAAIEIASRHLIVGHAVGESVVKGIIAELVALKKGE